jgi:dolichyl-phosphate-mannose--protein O-mannosyl transferase
VRGESISWDEGDHLFAGYMSLKHGDLGLNPEHPPLVKMVAALPLLGMNLRVPELQGRNFKVETFLDGKDFNAWNLAQGILFRARMAASFFTLLLALLVFLAAREMFGITAGFIALALFAFDPSFLAHGALVTTDAGVSCFIFASIYAFYRYAKAPSVGRVVVLGMATGLAFASKHTGVLMVPMLIVLAICEIIRHPRRASGETSDCRKTLTGNWPARLQALP